MKSNIPVHVSVDKVGLNATHFGSMKKEEAIAAMTKDNILQIHGKDAAWAAGAWEACVNELKTEADKPVKKK